MTAVQHLQRPEIMKRTTKMKLAVNTVYEICLNLHSVSNLSVSILQYHVLFFLLTFISVTIWQAGVKWTKGKNNNNVG